MTGRKLSYMRHAVGHLTADGIGILECGFGRYVVLYVVNDFTETVQRLCCLAVQADVAAEVQLRHLLWFLYDNGSAFRLAYKSKDFGMSVLAEDDNLFLMVLP